ncbi:MAG: DNA translocase FtsK [Candidatus Aminicenantaceae bacterium]
MREKKEKSSIKKTGLSEITAIILIFLAIFSITSLISYHPEDPSWTNAPPPDQNIHNFMGKVGAVFSDILLQLFGFSSFIIPFLFGYFGYKKFKQKKDKNFIKLALGAFFSILLISALLFKLFHSISWHKVPIRAGGLIGKTMSSFMTKYFSHEGTMIILFTLLIVLLSLYTKFSFRNAISYFVRFFNFIFKEVRIKITNYKKEKTRKQQKKKLKKEYTLPLKKAEKVPTSDNIFPQKSKKEKSELETFPEKYLFPEMDKNDTYHFPSLSLLDQSKEAHKIDKEELFEKKSLIEGKLREFRVEGEVREYHPGPVITTYEYSPQPGIKVSQVSNLTEDLSLALQAESVRIHRMPGKSSLGVEVPNNKREVIQIRNIIQSDKFQRSRSKLTFALGKTIHNEVYITDLSVMPHLLIAGATGTGKSVALNCLIASILYKATPDEVKLVLIDPKKLEFSVYEGIPHLLCPVIKDPKKAGSVLLDAIKKMEERYHKLGFHKARNIVQYNNQVKQILKENKGKLNKEEKENLKPLPYIVIIIDELSELMMIGAQEVEYSIARLAQLARAVGIHLVMATQRPSIDVITGTIKNNFSSRIAFRVPSKVDSRIIIDTAGAEKLLGSGDMLFMPPNYPRLIRLHCSYISLAETTRLVRFVKDQGKPIYDDKIVNVLKKSASQAKEEFEEKDELFDKAVELVLLTGQASASYLQRKLKLGYARASRIIDQMEQEKIVGPSEGSKPREIIVDPQSYLEKIKKEE